MSKKTNPDKSRPAKIRPEAGAETLNFPGWYFNEKILGWAVFIFAFLLYANTLTHNYTQDDAIVIYDNMFTTQGIKGIPGILKYDTFYGFFKEEGKAFLVSGGRYRPFTLVMFAIEWQLFGRNPFPGHLINVLLFGLTCVLLYKVLLLLFKQKVLQNQAYFIAFAATLLFAAHPVHTEVVANIKGRDEIMTLLGSLGALFFSLKAYNSQKNHWNLAAALLFMAALFSKENAITFLAVIPLAYYFFTKATLPKIAQQTLWLLIPAVIFLLVRGAVIGWQTGGEPMELMNNPFVKIEGDRYVPFTTSERLATIFFTLGKYVQLLIFPHPLTHDYYPRHIEIMQFGDWRVLLSLLIYLSLAVFAVRSLKTKNLFGFGIAFYLITLSIVSNFLFPVGTNMSERFIFMPSVGFCIAAALLVWKFSARKNENPAYEKIRPGLLLVTLIVLAFGVKTIARNFVWKDNYTLFTTDVETSVRSAKLQNAAAGELISKATKMEDEAARRPILLKAKEHLLKALEVHPNYKNAYLLLGNASNYLEEYEQAIDFYQKALQLDPAYKDAINNLAVTYRNAGRYYGEKKGDLAKALQYLTKSYEAQPDDYETLRLLGVAYGIQQNHPKAIEFFEKAATVQPENADALYNLGSAYFNSGDTEKGKTLHQKAIAIDPAVQSRMGGGK